MDPSHEQGLRGRDLKVVDLRAAVTGDHTFELIVEIDVSAISDFCWMVSRARIEDIVDDARRGLEVEDDFVFALRGMR